LKLIHSLFAVALAASTVPALAADVAKGERIARRWCATCHIVAPDQKTASADVPSFADIAARKPETKRLGNFLADPHPKMPPMNLSREEIADIIAYIRTLGPKLDEPSQGTDHELPKRG
jgi:mono/diheme cytochrome c family protein